MDVLLIARQRSGTAALGSILHRHPELLFGGEVLHPLNPMNKLSFAAFLRAHVEQALLFVQVATRAHAIEQYLAHARQTASPRRLVLDIKYDALRQWDQGPQGLFVRPWLLTYARKHQIPILHLRRHNYVATFVSGRLARQNNVWHTSGAETLNFRSITVPPKELRAFLNNCVRESALITEWLAGYDKVLTLEYEEMLDAQGSMTERTAAEIAAFLGIAPFTARDGRLIKQAPVTLADSIENFDEVAHSLRDTEFSWMLLPAPGR